MSERDLYEIMTDIRRQVETKLAVIALLSGFNFVLLLALLYKVSTL